MKRALAIILVIGLALQVSACAKSTTIGEVTYGVYGILNEGEMHNPNIKYEVSWGNVFWGIVLCETIIAPIYFFGYALYEPVGPMPEIKGQVPK